VDGLCMLYFVMGFANGPLFPACSVMLRDVPLRARSQASAVVDAGGTLGGCLATALCPWLASLVDWRRLYWMLAALAMGCAWVWAVLASDPASMSVSSGGKESGRKSSVGRPWALFAHPGPWALFFSHAVFNYSNYVLNAWLPTLFVERFQGVNPASVGAYLMWPEVVGIAARFGAAAVADRQLSDKQVTLLTVRRSSSVFAFLGQGLMLIQAARQVDPFYCAVLLTIAAGANGAHACGYKANYLDLTVAHLGVLTGVGNTLASAASAIGPAVTAATLDGKPGGFESLTMSLLCLNCLGAAICGVFLTTDCLDTTGEARDEEGPTSSPTSPLSPSQHASAAEPRHRPAVAKAVS